MYLYAIFLILSILAFFDIFIDRNKRSNVYAIIFVITVVFIFTISAFRWERGTDWTPYADYFEYCLDWNSTGWMEYGYTLLNKIVGSISNNYSLMIFVVAVIIYALKPKVLYKLAPYPFLALLTWYTISLADIFPVRQTIASALILYSILFIIKRELFPFLFFVILASTFHLTALIFIVTYFIYPIRISRFWSSVAFLGSFIMAFMAQELLVNFLVGISNPIIENRIAVYLNQGADDTFGSAYSTNQILIRGFINRGIIIVIIFLLLNKIRYQDKVFNGFTNLFLLSSIFFALLSSVNVALGRLVYYFDLSQIFIFSYIFTLKMSKPNKMIIFVVLVIYFLYRLNGVINNYYDYYIPYQSIFWDANESLTV